MIITKKKITKGDYGYLKHEKYKRFFLSLLSLSLVLLVFFAGLKIYGTNANILSIIAVLLALPTSKIWLSFLILTPFNSCKKEIYEISNIEGINKLYDLVISSEKRIYFVDACIIWNGNIILFVKQDYKYKKELQEYIICLLDKQSTYKNVKLISSKTMLEKLSKECEKLHQKIKQDEVTKKEDYIEKAFVNEQKLDQNIKNIILKYII